VQARTEYARSGDVNIAYQVVAGLSDPVAPDSIPTLEQRMDDVRAVMDATDLRARGAPRDDRSARLLMQMGGQADWTEFLPAVHVPTLVLHRAGDRVVPAAEGRRLAVGGRSRARRTSTFRATTTSSGPVIRTQSSRRSSRS
jgi:pimeloyl-ACP methyl ester carboxylesterase